MKLPATVRRRVIVIDDNEAIHEDLRKVLRSSSKASSQLDELEAALFGGSAAAGSGVAYDIDSAFQGLEGVEKVQQAIAADDPYMLAFVDMRMPPGIDGLETIERLWKVDPMLQVVVCTAFSDWSWSDMIERLGVTDRMLIIKKPFDQAEVCQAAAAMCEKWRLSRQATVKLDDLESIIGERTEQLRDANRQLETEIAERRAAEERARHDAFHDPLTNLPNRAYLLDQLTRCIARSHREPEYTFGILFLDIDDFKIINDSLGHTVGDEVLVTVAKRVVQCVRSLDTVVRREDDTTARLGGDEFVILVDGIKRSTDLLLIAERMQQHLAAPMKLDGTELAISTSIGVALNGPEHQHPSEILRDADIAMYRAKGSGKARFAVFNREMHDEAVDRLRLENDLRAAIDLGGLHVYYQPIIKLESGRIVGLEALLRWNRPEFGLVLPEEFIPLAEERGLIIPIGRWVLEHVCRQLHDWQHRLPNAAGLSVSVNLSKRQIAEPGLVQDVDRILRETGVDPSCINLEVTESGIMENSNEIASILEELAALGVELHMDDFGTGYSSLSCLHRYPLKVLKIDRSFLNTMAGNRDYAAVINAIMTLAHNLDMDVVAEGVELPDQVALLQTLECDCAQGFYFSHPLTLEQTEALLATDLMWKRKVA